LKFIKLPIIEPLIKLIPTIKLTGRLTVSSNIKLTFLLFELFCIPIIKIKKSDRLNVNIKKNFLAVNNIFIRNSYVIDTYYKLYFF
tara:strand:- start:469 stop:726 length:258 start_codon:yes stop_codon:yes gene_type:complete